MIYLIYKKADFERNASYVEWFKEEGEKVGFQVKLCFYEDLTLQLENKDVYLNQHLLASQDIVVNRSRDSRLSEFFEMNNIKVYNSAIIAKLGNDKLLAYAALKDFFSIPNTLSAFVGYKKSYSGIIKTYDGFGGNSIRLGNCIEASNEIFQEEIKDYLGDLRVYIIGSKIYASMLRVPDADSLVANFTKGNAFKEYFLSKEQETMIYDLLSAYPMDYAGIDFFVTKDHQLIFNEIEDVVGSRMLSTFGHRFNIVQAFFAHILEENIN